MCPSPFPKKSNIRWSCKYIPTMFSHMKNDWVANLGSFLFWFPCFPPLPRTILGQLQILLCSLRLLSTELHQACQTLLHSRMFRFLRSRKIGGQKSFKSKQLVGKPKKRCKLKTEEGRLGRKDCENGRDLARWNLTYLSLKRTARP